MIQYKNITDMLFKLEKVTFYKAFGLQILSMDTLGFLYMDYFLLVLSPENWLPSGCAVMTTDLFLVVSLKERCFGFYRISYPSISS